MPALLAAALTAIVVFGAVTASARAAESEAAANRRGYQLLRQGDVQGAIRVFEKNAAAYPHSANVYDSLAEAYVAAGDTARAIESYRKAVALDPRAKSARYKLARLTGEPVKLRPLVLFHIGGGLVALLAGAAAMVLRKGSRRHATVGKVFVAAMLAMALSATYMAFAAPDGEAVNRMMGLLTTYLVATAWATARRRQAAANAFDVAALVFVLAVAGGLFRYGLQAASSESGSKDGIPAAGYFVFGIVAVLAAAGDVRAMARGGLTGKPRIMRHLWRMGTALFIAAGSFFLGQAQVFPDAVRNAPGLLAAPVLLVLGAMLFWAIRVRFGGAARWAATEPA